MALVGEWRRRIVVSAGAGVAAPVAVIAAAIAVGFGGGGVHGLGALAQAVSGPVIPGQSGRVDGRPEADLLSRARSKRSARRARSAGAGSASSTATPIPGGQGTAGAPLRQQQSSGGRKAPAASTPIPDRTPNATPTSSPSVVRQVGDSVIPVVEGVPGVGPTGAQVVDGIVTAADGILPPPLGGLRP